MVGSRELRDSNPRWGQPSKQVQQLEGNFLAPFIMGRSVKLSPAPILFAVTAGGALAGVVGVFLAVPLTACAAATLLYAREQGAI